MPHRHLTTAAALAGLFCAAGAGPALAHHAFAAEFDANAPVNLRGTVTKMEWINPHAWMHITVSDPAKPPQEWMIEGGTPNTLFRNGLTPPHVAAGINLNMPVIGSLLRRGGAFFMRRTFKGNPLYTSVFNEYLHTLFTKGFPVEYFVEGGRSRTGRIF